MPSFLRLWLTHLWDQTRRKHGAIILIIDSKINQIIISLWMAFLDQQKKWVYYWEYFSSLTNVNVWSMHNQQVTWSDLLVLLLLKALPPIEKGLFPKLHIWSALFLGIQSKTFQSLFNAPRLRSSPRDTILPLSVIVYRTERSDTIKYSPSLKAIVQQYSKCQEKDCMKNKNKK